MVTFDYKKTPITQVADYIIMYAAKSGASDIHFDPKENGLMVRIRIDGELHDYTLIPKEYERNLTTRLKLLANMNITESRLPQDGAIKRQFGKLFLDMRVSSLPTNEGEKIVVRILDYSRSLQGLEHLGFSHTNFLKLKRMIEVPNGIILVTGATGTGKSTTTYSILQALNKPETNIITVEDPIEMNIEGLNQVQVNSEIGLDFATVLRSILRQDPNIILIGEIRDSETAKIAVRASITGHLVLSTIHTNNSLSTIERLLDMDVERYLLSSALTGIISQRLAKMLCPKCRIQRPATNYEKKIFKKVLGKEIEKIYDANHDGCSNCHHGYKGRIAVQEVLEIDNDIRNALNDEKLEREDLKKMVYTSNVITLLQDGLEKVLEGITSFEEIYRIIEIDSDSDENYSQELSDATKEQKEKERQEELSEKTSTEVKKSDMITTKANEYKETTEKSKEEETSSIKKEANKIQSIINQSKKGEEKNDIILSIPEVPVFPEPENDSTSNTLENKNSIPLEIPSGDINDTHLLDSSFNLSSSTFSQEPLEIPSGNLESFQQPPPSSLEVSTKIEDQKEETDQFSGNKISFSSNHGEIPTIQQDQITNSNQIEFSNHLEKLENEPSNLDHITQETSFTNQENTTQKEISSQNTSTNKKEIPLDSNTSNQETNHLQSSINLLSDVPTNYPTNPTINQDSTLHKEEKDQEKTLEHISINPRLEPQLIEQSAPLTPTVTELE